MKIKQQTARKEKKTDLIMLILLILILIAPVKAAPQIQLINQIDPVEYGEVQTIKINITPSDTNTTTNTTIIQALIEFEERNHTLEKETGYYTYSWVPQQKGTNTYKIYAASSDNQTQNYTNTFQVIDTNPPKITETLPKGTINYNLVEIKVVTNENSTCKYDTANVSYDSMHYPLSDQGQNHAQLRSFEDGEILLYARCKDTSGNIGQSQIISFIIDAMPPVVTGITPTGTVNQAGIDLKVSTNEIATCRWSKINQPYDSLENQFQTTGATLHSQPLNLNQGINTYYIGCRDPTGNKAPIIVLNIELNLPPTATINVERNNSYHVLGQGTYDLSLATSKALSQAPLLKLKVSSRLINIPLEGGSQTWNGYLIIPSDMGEDIGEFQYSGIDTKGTTGTEITSGKLIMIDTTIPAMPTNLKLVNENNKMRITWEYLQEPQENIDHFNIYRSTTGNTGAADFKTTSPSTSYLDTDVTNKIGYFYRISAVDKAGNEGLLSDEEFLMTEYQNNTAQFNQDPEILAIVNSKITELERITQDLDVKISRLEETTDQSVLEIINQEGLVSKQKEIKSKIQTLTGELKTYKETKITKEELNAKISVINSKIGEYKKGIIQEVKVLSSIRKEQIPEENIVQETINEYLKNKALTEEQRQAYYAKTKILQGEARIQQSLASYEISYEYKESEKIILIKETIISAKELNGVMAQEFIPKEALKVSEITFNTNPNDFNSLGIQWLLSDLENSEIKYITQEEKDLNQLQSIRTVLLYDLDWFLSSLSEDKFNESSQITGEAIIDNNPGFSITKIVLIPIGILMVIGLIAYYFFFLKTEKFYEKDILTRLDKEEEGVIASLNLPKTQPNASRVSKTRIEAFSNQDLDLIHSLIQQANNELNQGNIEAASKIYSLALSRYTQAKFSFKQRLEVNLMMNKLRDNITDAQKIAV